MKYFIEIPSDLEVQREYKITPDFHQHIMRLQLAYNMMDGHVRNNKLPSELRAILRKNMDKVSDLSNVFEDKFAIDLFSIKQNTVIKFTENLALDHDILTVIEQINQILASVDEQAYRIFTGENPLDLLK